MSRRGRLKYEDIEGAFDGATDTERQLVMELAADFHFRNGVKHNDGSMGEIKITPGQLNDCLAHMLSYH